MKCLSFLCLITFTVQGAERKIPYTRRFQITQEMQHHFNQEGDAFYTNTLSVHVSAKDEVGVSLSSSSQGHAVYKTYDTQNIRLGFNPTHWDVTEKDFRKHTKIKRAEFPKGTKVQTIYDSVSLESLIGAIAELNKGSKGTLRFLGTKFTVLTKKTPTGIRLNEVIGGKTEEGNKAIYDLFRRYLRLSRPTQDSQHMFFSFTNETIPLNYVEGFVMFGLSTDMQPGIVTIE